jgi:hypothetical protein
MCVYMKIHMIVSLGQKDIDVLHAVLCPAEARAGPRQEKR